MSAFSFDPAKTPFSRFGSYLVINQLWDWATGPGKPPGWYLRSVRGPTEMFRLQALKGGREVPFTARATAGRLTFEAEGGGTIEFCFQDDDTFRVRARGCALGLSSVMGPYGYAYGHGEDIHVLNTTRSEHVLLRPLAGRIERDIHWVHGPWNDFVDRAEFTLAAENGEAEAMIHLRVSAPRPPADLPPFDACADRTEADFADFYAVFPPVMPPWAEAAAWAAHCLWATTVRPEGLFRRPAILMSKNWMTNVWFWDHCFVAFGLARAHPDLAWDQFALAFDVQDESGLFPDYINAREASWLVSKPPIHGWALRRLLATGRFTDDHRREAYGPLSRWADYWMTDRDLDGDGLPCFLHGNEQFDNNTLFQVHAPYKSADLAAHVVLLQETLGDLADALGKAREANDWKNRAAALRERIVPEFWRDGRFVSPRIGDGFTAEGDCLFRYTALILGRGLPPEVTQTMIADLRVPGRFRTEHGPLATEALTSPFYEDPSYVRGPLWVPPNMFISDGLRDLGEIEAADEIRDGFLRLCARDGMWENFHPVSGAGQRDPAYTWTAGACLAWAQEASEGLTSASPG